MNRILFFVHYNKYDGLSEHVVYLLERIKHLYSRVVFISNSALSNTQKDKLVGLYHTIILRENKGFDFGAWKDALLQEGWDALSRCDSVTLMNDTCFGPLFDMGEVYDKMEGRDCDFWGLTSHKAWDGGMPGTNGPIPEHIQSYFLCFNKPALVSPAFHKFWGDVEYEAEREKVVQKYETQLTRILAAEKLRWSVFIDVEAANPNPMMFCPDKMIKNHSPFLKIRSFSIVSLPSYLIKVVKDNTDYPARFIYDYFTGTSILHLEKRYQSGFYFDTGNGFNDDEKALLSFNADNNSDELVCHEIAVPDGAKAVRFDPVEDAGCLLYGLEIISLSGVLKFDAINGVLCDDGDMIFTTSDPQVLIHGAWRWLKLRCNIIPFTDIAHFHLMENYRKSHDIISELKTLLRTQESEHKAELEGERLRGVEEADRLKAELEGERLRGVEEADRLKAELEGERLRGVEEADRLKAELEGERLRGVEEADRLRTELEAERRRHSDELADELGKLREGHEAEMARIKEEKDAVQNACNYYSTQHSLALAERDVLQSKLSGAEAAFNSIINSKSWRITKPCRIVFDVLRKIKPLRLFVKSIRSLKKNGIEVTLEKVRSYCSNIELEVDSEYQENYDFSNFEPQIKTIAYYLPQFHVIPENDEWWGKGFTEWVNTKKATARFEGHYQPREPHDDIGYYDLSDVEVLKRQAKLARQHGIYAFCFYLYWFSGKKLLEKPIDMLLAHPEIDMRFCLCWANENWTRAWDGQDKEVLLWQNYSDDDPARFIDYIQKYIDDKRYVRVSGKPVIVVYNPGHIKNSKKTFNEWRKHARTIGVGEILIWTCRTCNNTAENLNIMDAVDAEVEFPPHNMWWESAGIRGVDLKGLSAGLYDYQKIVDINAENLKKEEGLPVYHACMMAWDNAARRADNWITYCRFSLKSFYMWVNAIKEKALERFEKEEAFIFVNAWNEWAEGTYLEPDKKYGYATINTLSKAVYGMPFDGGVKVIHNALKHKDPLLEKEESKIAVQVHLFYIDLMDEVIKNVNCIPYSFDCYISTDSVEKGDKIKTKFINECKARNVVVKSFENRGRDVAPFVLQLAPVIDKYDFICHIHTKKSDTEGYGGYWRKYLYKHLLGNANYIHALFDEFRKDKKLGLIFPETYPALKNQAEWGGNKAGVAALLMKMGVEIALGGDAVFPVGNMFWARANAVRKLFGLGLAQEDFPPESGQVNATLAHEIERVWVYLARSEGCHYQKMFNGVSDKKDIGVTRKNIALFAHYDKNNVISDDDMEYLKSVKQIADDIIFISNSSLSKKELQKVSTIVNKTILRKNEGYDFGMWKKALETLSKEVLDKYNHLILANNSCYAPVRNLGEVFVEMEERKSDFWGILLFPYINDGSFIGKSHIDEHLQSFFLVFTRKAFSHNAFASFWKNCGEYNTLEEVVGNCESVLTKTLADAGLTYSAYVEESGYLCSRLANYSLPYTYPYQMLLTGSPFLKKKYVKYADMDEKISAEFFIRENRR